MYVTYGSMVPAPPWGTRVLCNRHIVIRCSIGTLCLGLMMHAWWWLWWWMGWGGWCLVVIFLKNSLNHLNIAYSVRSGFLAFLWLLCQRFSLLIPLPGGYAMAVSCALQLCSAAVLCSWAPFSH